MDKSKAMTVRELREALGKLNQDDEVCIVDLKSGEVIGVAADVGLHNNVIWMQAIE